MSASSAASALGFPGAESMQASFQAFLERPENRKLVEKQQRKEVRQAVAAQERARVLEFRDRLLEAPLEAQAAVAPFLKRPVLRRIVQTFANDERGDFERWATNPRVLDMLRRAEEAIAGGRVTEAEIEQALLAQLRDPKTEGHDEFQAASKLVARLPTEALVGALNEHVRKNRGGLRRG